MAVGFIKTSIILITGRIILPKKDDDGEIEREKRPPIKEAFKTSLKKSKKTIKRILVLTIPITFIVFILIDLGVFEIIADHLSGIVRYFPIQAEGLPVIAAQFANRIAAYTIAGNLLSEGILNPKDIILTLLVGNVLSSIVQLRFTIPYYFGIFGTKLGTQILAISTGLRIVIMILMIAALAMT